MFDGLRVWDGHEGPRARITIGPGTVAVSRRDLARRERALAREEKRRQAKVDLLAAYLAEHGELPPDLPGRGEITQWSRKSRANMWRATSELDYAALLRPGVEPAMVTLTYPGDWTTVAPNGRAAKRHLYALRKRYRRAWGTELTAIWKLEFQGRGAPHFHLFMVPPTGYAGDPRLAVAPGLPFPQWLSQTWADIVAHPDPDERARHVRAGTGVDPPSVIDFDAGLRAYDPRRVAVYFAKHAQGRAKEYQHKVPALWTRPGQGPGRFWGYWQVTRQTRVVEVDERTAVLAARTMRRWARAQRVTNERRVPRAPGGAIPPGHVFDRRIVGLAGKLLFLAHAPRYRRVRRRVDRMKRGAGWISVNDGASFAANLARLLTRLLAPDPAYAATG